MESLADFLVVSSQLADSKQVVSSPANSPANSLAVQPSETSVQLAGVSSQLADSKQSANYMLTTEQRELRSLGGKLAAANMTAEQRSERARKAANARYKKKRAIGFDPHSNGLGFWGHK